MPMNFQYFNINQITDNLVSVVGGKKIPIEMVEVGVQQPQKSLFINRDDVYVKERKKYSMFQTLGQGLWAFFTDDMTPEEKDIGKVILEAGYIDPDGTLDKFESMSGGAYEAMELRLFTAVNLRNGKVLPPCKIQLVKDYDSFIHERQDYCRQFGLYLPSRKLKNIIEDDALIKADQRTF